MTVAAVTIEAVGDMAVVAVLFKKFRITNRFSATRVVIAWSKIRS
jgi:hypothetical protein